MTDEGEDDLAIFQDGLYTLFAHHQPAHGDPGTSHVFAHGRVTLHYGIPAQSASNTRLFAHYQWDAGLLLARMVADARVDVRAQSVVELGAGTGLPGLVAASVGAAKTVITDYPDETVLTNLRANVDRVAGAGAGAAVVLPLAWGDADAERQVLAANGGRGYERVLAADVLWVSSAHPLLIHTIRALLARTPSARCTLVAGFHTGIPAVRRFFAALGPDILPDWQAPFRGIHEHSFHGSTRPWSGGWIPSHGDSDTHTHLEQQHEQEMGDMSERAAWVVVASLRWAPHLV